MNKTIAILSILLALLIGLIGGYAQGKAEVRDKTETAISALEEKINTLETKKVDEIIKFLQQAQQQTQK